MLKGPFCQICTHLIVFFKISPDILLTIPYQLTKFQDCGLNTFPGLPLPIFSKGRNFTRGDNLETRFDVYETLCPQQMLVHKGAFILRTGVGSAETSHLQNCSVKIIKDHCRYFTKITNFQSPNLQSEINW